MGYPRGIKELQRYQLDGKKLSPMQSMKAKCAECMGNYEDGKMDCAIPDCPIYPFMVYGAVWKGRLKKIIPPDRVNAFRNRLKSTRKELSIDS